MKIVKKIILIIVIIILLIVLYAKYVKQEQIIKIFGNACLIVVTGSMEDTILQGELIIISEKENYKIGDIVTYIDEDNFLVTHRIVEIKDGYFISKGDGNNIKDDPCKINKIQGKVIFHSRILGFFILYLLKPICILYAITILIIEFLKLNKEGEKENEKQI